MIEGEDSVIRCRNAVQEEINYIVRPKVIVCFRQMILVFAVLRFELQEKA